MLSSNPRAIKRRADLTKKKQDAIDAAKAAKEEGRKNLMLQSRIIIGTRKQTPMTKLVSRPVKIS